MGGEARGGDGEAWCGGFWGNGAAMSAHDGGGGACRNGSGFLFRLDAHRGREKRGEVEGWRAVDVVAPLGARNPTGGPMAGERTPRRAHAAVTA
jgi:hypothetical protein